MCYHIKLYGRLSSICFVSLRSFFFKFLWTKAFSSLLLTLSKGREFGKAALSQSRGALEVKCVFYKAIPRNQSFLLTNKFLNDFVNQGLVPPSTLSLAFQDEWQREPPSQGPSVFPDLGDIWIFPAVRRAFHEERAMLQPQGKQAAFPRRKHVG